MASKQWLKERERVIEEHYKKLKKTGMYKEGYLEKEKEKSLNKLREQTAHPDTMGKTPATILLIVGMIGSLIFKQWYLIWAMLLLWYFGKDRV